MPTVIPAGTLLYHGRDNDTLPVSLDWLAFDFELSNILCRYDCYLLSYIISRPLHLAYLDGLSASQLLVGPLDIQDILIWGKPRPDKGEAIRERIKLMCEWGTRVGLDGFVRMEMHLYVQMSAAVPHSLISVLSRSAVKSCCAISRTEWSSSHYRISFFTIPIIHT